MAKTDKELTVELGEETVGRMLREVYDVIHDLPGEPESKRRWL